MNDEFDQTRILINDSESKLSDPQLARQISESELLSLKKVLIKSYKAREKIQKAINDLN